MADNWGEVPTDNYENPGNTPLPRTQKEIAAHWNERTKQDVFGFEGEVYFGALSSPAADSFIKDEYKGTHEASVTSVEQALSLAKDYCRFAWGKVIDHRGLSAGRSVMKLSAWMWLIGRDDLAELVVREDLYAPYGAPALKALCFELGWPWPEDDPAVRRMVSGDPCRPGCEEGCNS